MKNILNLYFYVKQKTREHSYSGYFSYFTRAINCVMVSDKKSGL